MNDLEDIKDLQENFDDFFNNTLCGYAITTPQGIITRANKVLSGWLSCSPQDLKGKKFQDLLGIAGKIYYETHLWPMLRMQGYFEEVALELACINEQKLPVFINAMERTIENKTPAFIRFTIFKATDRRQYEENLKKSKISLETSLADALQMATLRDQLIAILGHDLRNPLGSIMVASSMLAESSLSGNEQEIVKIIQRSSARMNELIGNIMDFARTRLGEGIVIDRKSTQMEPVLIHVVEELKTIWPTRVITTEFDLSTPVICDAPRISQLASNLIANAIVHGSIDTPVLVKGTFLDGVFKLEVTNEGHPIPADHIERLFEPFTRESTRPSQQGLGLGLYIASQISRAHHGTITVESTDKLTRFTFIIAQ